LIPELLLNRMSRSDQREDEDAASTHREMLDDVAPSGIT
jgi:hypothetical protein